MVNTALRYAAFIAAGYALLVLVVFLMQRHMLYHPDKERPTEANLASLGLRFWPRERGYMALISSTLPRTANGTIVVFHGNAGSAWHRVYYVNALEPMGYRVLLAEYPGYGGRGGDLSETRIIADAKATVSAARTDFGEPLFVIGESMGCGVAAAVAADPSQKIAGLLLITPWDSLAALAQTHYWYLPAAWLTKDQFNSVTRLAAFDRPVAIAMAEKDKVIPNRHTLTLFKTLTAPKKLWRFPDAGHNDWPNHPSAPWWKEALGFIASPGQPAAQQ